MTTKVTSYLVGPFILFVLIFAVTGGFNTEIISVLWECFVAVVVIGMFFSMLSAFSENRNLTGALLGATGRGSGSYRILDGALNYDNQSN